MKILLTLLRKTDIVNVQYKKQIDQEGARMKSKPVESKREKFVRLAEARTNKIIDTLQLLANCSNTSAYEYTSEDVQQIFDAIEFEVKEAKKKFNKVETSKLSRFTLK